MRGIVQAVGCSPFVYALARRHTLSGLLRNDAACHRIDVDAAPGELLVLLRR